VQQPWPGWDEGLTIDDVVTVVVQVNGKLRGQFSAARDCPSKELEMLALANESARKHLEGKTVRKIIVVPNKLVNVVVS
jgi:leucyl-tRNA synthetase